MGACPRRAAGLLRSAIPRIVSGGGAGSRPRRAGVRGDRELALPAGVALGHVVAGARDRESGVRDRRESLWGRSEVFLIRAVHDRRSAWENSGGWRGGTGVD